MLVDLPGVGKNLQDHIFAVGVDFLADKSLKPPGELWTYRQNEIQNIPNILLHTLFGRGPLTSKSGLDAMGFVRTRFANQSEPLMPDYQLNFIAGCLNAGCLNYNIRSLFEHFGIQQITDERCVVSLA